MFKKSFLRNNSDKWFSIYIRLRDAYSGSGFVRCITCPTIGHWKTMTNGHFVKRNKPMTRFNEENCAAQCVHCNGYADGEQFKHGKAIDKKYGSGTAEKLMQLGNIRGQKIHTKFHLEIIAKEYRLKSREMARLKGIEL